MEVCFLYRFSAKEIFSGGIFIALTIIFTHIFSVQTPFIRISFGFLPLAVYSAVFGPLPGGLLGAAADILGCMIFSPGSYFPGFTLSSFLSGCTYGLLLHGRPVSIKRIILACTLIFLLLDTILNTLWLSLLYHKAAAIFFTGRLIKGIIFLPVNIFLLYIIYRPVSEYVSGGRRKSKKP